MDWNRAASQLARELDCLRLSPTAREQLEGLETVFVACSGGADSALALLACRAFFESRGRNVSTIVLHLNHGLRGEASDGDARFVQAACRELNIRCEVGNAVWSKGIDDVNEADAREKRLSFFESVVSKTGLDSATIVTGHHADDIVETVLMRLSRGSGIQGLTAPRELSRASKRIQFLRPLLGLDREEIRGILRRLSVPWREDASNLGEANYRSRIRNLVIPAWENASDRPIRPGLVRSRALLEEDWRALEAWADEAWGEAYVAAEASLNRVAVSRYPVAIRRRLLARLCCEAGEGVCLSAAVAEESLQRIAFGGRASFELSPRWRLDFGKTTIRLEPLDRETASWGNFRLPVGCCAYLPDGARVCCERVDLQPIDLERIRSGRVDDKSAVFVSPPEKQCGGLVVRRREDGDAFKPHGKSSPQKIKLLFIDRKVAAAERLRLPVFETAAAKIVWVPGLPPAADYLLGADSRAALRLTYER